MKNIKTIVILAVCLASSLLLKAQQAKQAETQVTTTPPKPDVNKMPAAPKTAGQSTADMKVGKAVLLQAPVNPNSNLTAEQLKTANGTAEKPITIIAPGTEQKPVKTTPVKAVAPVDQ